MADLTDYGTLVHLLGTWTGDKGFDLAPEPDGDEATPYYETIIYTGKGIANNAEQQDLAVVHYHQLVQKKENGEMFHDQCGYWMWDIAQKIMMHSFVIPRGVAVLAGGTVREEDDVIICEVEAKAGDLQWGVLQSPFMDQKAKTVSFQQTLEIKKEVLAYSQTTVLDIYGKIFQHTDRNELTRSE
jgi:hypothetical protein